MIQARFDDLRPAQRRSFRLAGLIEVLAATDLSQVLDVIGRAEAAVHAGRWVAGWVGYEAAPAFDQALVVTDPRGTALERLPLAWFAVFESRASTRPRQGEEYSLGGWVPTVEKDEYLEAVASIRAHIRQGRTYQVNHTFRLAAPFQGSASSLYHDLTHSQSAGYGAFIHTGEWSVVSASPELFFEWESGLITSRPMKGTARRGLDVVDDEEHRRWLAGSEKNRAENLMIVDMVRNDLGRIAHVGSVQVPEMFATEKYDTVWQLTSTVTARPQQATTLVDVFTALFPSASITGAPKVATMGIIEALESEPRGVYCGAVGFGGPGLDGTPRWAFNVAIRTVLVDETTGVAWYGTGGGVTYDSTAHDEYAEALLKARVLERRTADFELLETMSWDPVTAIPLLERHLDRAERSARYFDIPFDRERLLALTGSVEGTEPLPVRLLIHRSGTARIEIAAPTATRARPRLAVDSIPVDRFDPFLHHKTTIRDTYEKAAARHPDADDVILVNSYGEITETTIANLAVRIAGEWCTPPTASGCLPGVRRAELLEHGTIVERSLTVGDLRTAEAIARFNALRPWEECDLLSPQSA